MNRFMLLICMFSVGILAAAGKAPADVCKETDDSVLLQGRVHQIAPDQPVIVSLDEVDIIKATFISPLAETQRQAKISAVSASNVKGTHTNKCFDGRAWLEAFAKEPSWQKHSQGDQDHVLSSLFSKEHLGTTDKNFVEFGFPDYDFSTSYGNGRNLKEALGFNSVLLMDGKSSNPEINLHKKFVTAANVVGLFDQFKVPIEADYISVDIDSCDLWAFFAITEKYRPRVMTVEYNSNYAMDNYSTLRCDNPTSKGAYYWKGDNIYGTSLSAIELAAKKRGYSLVYVTPRLDAFLVRSDLLCQGTDVPKARFNAATNLPQNNPYAGDFGPKSQLLMDFKEWLSAHP